MQPTHSQVERSLAALRDAGPVTQDANPSAHPDAPAEVIEVILALPPVREDRLDGVRSRISQGMIPDADALADKMVGRLVCDRLR